MPNRLLNESSPYLQQHAHNPVDWYPWGAEALQKSRAENKPILVSIGYAACHWCHVMERESFEDAATAAYMNEHFVNIKIDREERPDLDHIYMDAVQAITGSGGWPLNVFLTPEAKPFYGGTYFPPKPAFNRASWMDVLQSVQQAFNERRHEMDAQAENLTEHIRKTSEWGMERPENQMAFTTQHTAEIAKNILASADKTEGGFGKAPKFPQTFSIRFLLRFYHESMLAGRETATAKEGLEQALLSLDKMIDGGLYDQVGGGFARYSTDAEWLAPHFEKMLYDNALIVMVLAEAYQLTQHERYREVIEETLAFVEREMTSPEGGFYSALDADSEGEEGKFYVWQKEEVEEVLAADANLFSRFYDVTPGGNWEHKNILRVRQSVESFAEEVGKPVGDVKEIVKRGKQKLLERRDKRPRPLLDDKIILGWNALMNSAYCKAYAATGQASYLETATRNMQFLVTHFKSENGFNHTWKNNQAKYPAFLDDLAFLVSAMLDLQEVSSDQHWLDEAGKLSDEILSGFSDSENRFFYFTPAGQEDVILRKKEIYDGAVPSGNSVMAENFLRLSVLLDRPELKKRAEEMVGALQPVILKYPTSFGQWASVLLSMVSGLLEIAITGEEMNAIRADFLKQYVPNRVLQTAFTNDEIYPLLRQRKIEGKTAIWLCRNYTCLPPVFSVEDLITLINRVGKG